MFLTDLAYRILITKNLPFPNPVPFFRHTLISLDEFTFLLIQSRTMEPKRAVEAIIERFCDIFDLLLGNHMPWCDRTVIADCEKQVKEAASGASNEVKSEKTMRLSWALVHSKQRKDVQRGIEMLEALLTNCSSPLENREKLYLLGVGYYRTGKFPRSGQLADQCLEITPDWSMALTLKKDVEDRLARDVAVEMGVTASAVGLIGRWLAAVLTR